MRLAPGDTFIDDAGTWEVAGQPRSQRAGKSVAVKASVLAIWKRSVRSGGTAMSDSTMRFPRCEH